ncbi:MAG: DUF3179 domain-containing protein [Verrucomicrobia bacterium]|nr:DUF3179 domain-containing protein [Verrucomicrobiota bacterium]
MLAVGAGFLISSATLGQVTTLEKPAYFQTLVNPACSHCVDEAKRRAGELRDDDRVLAWIRGKYDGGAVPFRFFLVPYRVISDTYGVWVYDADAGFVRGFEPSLDFTFHGWRNGVIVIQHKDGTLFSSLSGEAFAGPRKGTKLKPLATLETDWGYWLKAYPGTVAYNMFPKYVAHELPTALNSDSVSTRPTEDKRLGNDEPVIGIAIGDQAKAYPISLLVTNHVVWDKIGEQELVVLWYAPTKTAAIYAPRMDNGDVPARLKLERNAQIPTAPFMDKETFSHWNIEGRAVEGPLKGKTLVWLPGVQCKWFAWAAEYPNTSIYTPADKRAEASEAIVARLIQGERLDWQKLVKTTGHLVNMDPAGKSLTVFTDHDKKEHQLWFTPQTEYHVEGAFGSLAEFSPGQSVYVIATVNEKKELASVHALADDLSMQAMARPLVLKEYDRKNGRLSFIDEKSRKPTVELNVNANTRFPAEPSAQIQPGRVYYFTSTHTGTERTATELLDESAFEARKNQRLQRQRDDLLKHGLSGTVLNVDAANHRIEVMIRRSDTWFARSWRLNAAVQFMAAAQPTVAGKIIAVQPDYSRVRIRLDFTGLATPEVQAGDEVAILGKLPDKIDFDAPPDLGRFIGRQERIDYFLSTIYCSCGMLGSSCAGHWNTLAACQLHGCGMPNLITKLVGERIDVGKTDEAILAELIERNGKNILKLHQN